MGVLDGRRGLVVGMANEWSLATGIARAAAAEGARLAVSYQDERLRKRVEPLAAELGAELVARCDLLAPDDVSALAAQLKERFAALDFVVHAVAFANKEDLAGRFVDTSREGFHTALDASAFSLVALVRALEPLLLLGDAPSVLTLTYLGSSRAIPFYNVMGVAKAALEASVRYLAAELGPQGIRVNALSPGAVKTLSSAGVRGLRSMLTYSAEQAPLRRNVTAADVGRAALVHLSTWGAGITGEVLYVDGGYHLLGAPRLEP